MRKILAFILVVLLSISVSIAADSYTESFGETGSKAHLDNLTVVPSMQSILYGAAEDVPGYGLRQSTDRSGEIRYTVQGVEQLTVGFYSRYPSYACWDGSNWLIAMPGASFSGKMTPMYLGEDGVPYLLENGSWYQYRFNQYSGSFQKVEQAPASYVPMNLQVLAVDSAGKAHSLSGSSSGVKPILAYGNAIVSYYEERTYQVPAGTQELIFSLNFPWTNLDESGSPTARPMIQNPVTVTRIRLDGTNLLFDQPPKPEQSSSVPEQSSSSGSGSSSGAGGGGGAGGITVPGGWDDEIILPDNTSDATRLDQTHMPESSPEELISGSSSEASSSGKKSSSGKTGSASSGGQKAGGEDPDSDSRGESEPESETLIFQTDRSDLRDKLFSIMLAGYGMIGLGVAWQIYRHTSRKQ